MKIIVDAMGGDHAPAEVLRGCVMAVEELGVQIVLVGRGEVILQAIKDDGHAELPKGLEIAHADDIVDMEDNPATTLKEKPESSMAVGLRLLAEGGGNAFVSAGNTGALLSAGTFTVKRIKGIRRAALAPAIPTKAGHALLIDSGANLECTPEYLLQFAFMGSYYMEHVMKVTAPRVGLLNVGAEETKGLSLQKEAFALLKNAADMKQINFIGNIEARDAILGGADVIVCDGFSGNVMLKAMEGVGLYFAGMLKGMFMKNILTKLAGLLVSGGIREFKKTMDYSEAGGALLLGLSKPVIKAHGSSKATAIKNAVRQAAALSEAGVVEKISANISQMKTAEPAG